MIISFADCAGASDVCSGETTGAVITNVGGVLPVGDGYADGPNSGTTRTVGVNDFRIFALGNGPDLRQPVSTTVAGTPGTVLKIDMQVDCTLHSGLAVSEEGTVYVISGGTPAGIGTNPSPMLSEVLCFEDQCPADRRGDFVDLRGNGVPNPPASGGNVGDGDSDRFDHIYYQAPLDQVTLTPGGLAGLSRGFLRYAWRLAPNEMGPGVTLGLTGGKTRQGDDDTDGPIIFEFLDPGHQVAGGDDQNTPFRGDDNDGAGSPAIPSVPNSSAPGTLRNGGFEFVFGGPVGTAVCTWNGFFLNSNGNVTFGAGDTSNNANVPDFRAGLPKIAPAWTDLNPSACSLDLRDFPVQALGFANVNAFKVRWINVPEFGSEVCTGDGGGFSNTFSVTLYDDGTGIDENANQPLNPANPIGNNSVPFDLQEGPTDLRFTAVTLPTCTPPSTTPAPVIVGCPPRPSGSGIFVFDFCRMDLLGRPENNHQVITGYSIGGLDPLNPPGLCETNLSVVSAAADTTFGVLDGQIAAVGCNCCIGEGTEPTIFELFNEGRGSTVGSGGEVTLATPDFDLRFEGNDAALCTATRQRDQNRGRVCFLGVSCNPPTNPLCQVVAPCSFAVTPTTSGLVNSLCAVQLNILGCGFFPNEVTTICQGFNSATGIPLLRPGKTVSTAATLACDTNGDGIAETVVALTNVTPVNCNLVRATIPVSASFGSTSSSGFPAACCGGAGTVTVTTTFTTGDNNVFGPFTRTAVCSLALGTRAPLVLSVTPSSGTCNGVVLQNVLITGACFVIDGVPNVTSVSAIDQANAGTVVVGKNIVILSPTLLSVDLPFTSANAGKAFLVFLTGPNGTSRGITSPVTGAPTGCPLGNEEGCLPCITFTCNATVPAACPGPDPRCNTSVEQALVNGCKLDRNSAGRCIPDVFGKNLKPDADIRVGSATPKKVKPREPDPSFPGAFLRLTLKGRICAGLPGTIVVTNPPSVPGGPTAPSQPFACTESCATK